MDDDGEDGYDAYFGPDPVAWLALDEEERLDLVVDFHDELGVDLPNAQFHATMHVIVENQIAERVDPRVAAAIDRHMAAGLDRHEALHVVGAVLMEHLHSLLNTPEPPADANEAYYRKLEGPSTE